MAQETSERSLRPTPVLRPSLRALHDQIVLHMGNEGTSRMIWSDIERISRLLPW
jgi:hypothetical protein